MVGTDVVPTAICTVGRLTDTFFRVVVTKTHRYYMLSPPHKYVLLRYQLLYRVIHSYARKAFRQVIAETKALETGDVLVASAPHVDTDDGL